MKSNLAEHRRIFVDSGPYKILTENDLSLLRDSDTDGVGITVSAGETLSVICDLGARYRLDEIFYYRLAPTLENLTFFGRQGETADFPWIELSYTVDGQLVTIDLTSSSDRYEFIRVVHTVLDDTDPCIVYELQIFTSEEEIKFGEQAEINVFSVDSGTSTLKPEEIAIFNPAPIELEMFCLFDGDDNDSQGLQMSPTLTGTFETLYSSGISIPDDFTWSAGQFENTHEVSNAVTLVSGTISGTYYTPVIDISSLGGRRLFWKPTLTGTTDIDIFGSEDSVSVIDVRFSNQAPTDVGWMSGQLSTDANWAIGSGAIPFTPYDNNHILNLQYMNYFQARLEFHTMVSGEAPVLEKVGIEEGLSITISGNSHNSIYVQSTYPEHIFGRDSKLIVWYFESRNEEQ